MNNLLNQQPILYEPVAKQQYDRLSKQAADARALRALSAGESEVAKREPSLGLGLKVALKVLQRTWITALQWIHALKPKVFKEA